MEAEENIRLLRNSEKQAEVKWENQKGYREEVILKIRKKWDRKLEEW